MAAIASVGSVGAALADDDDPPAEAYPPTPTLAPEKPPPPREIPKTGNDGTDAWLKLGAGAVLAGGVLVTATARRRQQEVAAS